MEFEHFPLVSPRLTGMIHESDSMHRSPHFFAIRLAATRMLLTQRATEATTIRTAHYWMLCVILFL